MNKMQKFLQIMNHEQHRAGKKLLALMLLGMILEMVGVGLVIPVVIVLMQQDLATSYPMFRHTLDVVGLYSQVEMVAGAMLALVGIYFLKSLFLSYLAWQRARFGFGLQAELSQRLYALYLSLPYTFHLQRNSAQLIRNASSEITMLTGYVIIPGMQLLAEGLVLIGLCAVLVVVEPLGTAAVIIVLGGAVWGFHRALRDRISGWGKSRQYHEGMRIQHLQQGLGSIKDVKLLGREAEFIKQFSEHVSHSARASQKQTTLNQIPGLWLELLGVVGLVGLVLVMLLQGHEPVTIVPTLGLFAAAAFRLMPSANRILASMQSLRYGLPVGDLLHAELKLGDAKVDHDGRGNGAVIQSDITVSNISYIYPGAVNPAIDQVSLEIHKGESVGFIGTSGSGKSTLVDLILGLLSPQAGMVLVDGGDVHEALGSWQDQIGYVPQSIYLTDDTLSSNIAFGVSAEKIDDQAVRRAIKAAQLDDLVESLPEGLAAMVGERGVRLSGGQRQRVGIARALYHDPAVLVLDEATSALDTTTEEEVMRAVTALHGSKTILIIAHRLSTVAQCDKLFRLEKGCLVGISSPADILEESMDIRRANE